MKFKLEMDGNQFDIELRMGRTILVWIENETFQVQVKHVNGRTKIFLENQEFDVNLKKSHIFINEHRHNFSVHNVRRSTPSATLHKNVSHKDIRTSKAEGTIYSPMPGRIISIKTKVDDEVNIGTPLLILEAMKMQNEVISPVKGIVRAIKFSVGALVETKDALIIIE